MNNELNQLHGLALEADALALPPAPPPVGEDGQPLPPPPDFVTEAAGAVDMFSALVVGYCPTAETIWTVETKGRIAAALAPVMEKYGVTFGTLPPEITLIFVAGPPLWQSSKLVAQQINADKAKAAEEKPRQVQQAQQAETPIQEVHAQMGLYR